MDLIFPLIAHAQGSASGFKLLVYRISDYILNPLIKLGFVVALVIFLWGVVDYIRDKNSGFIFDKDGKKSGDGASRIVWGLIGLFVMVSAYGILNMIKGLLGSDVPLP